MNIAIVGTGYVGLVTGVCLSDIGHQVTCIDVDESKVAKLQAGLSPIYEPGLEELMRRNIEAGRLRFTHRHEEGFRDAEAIYIAVGTPSREDGTADLRYVENVAMTIARHLQKYVVVVTKSTVPVGTNFRIRQILREYGPEGAEFDVVSNPEFLREGSAVHDAFHGDRIVIGAESERAAALVEEINKPFGIPIFKTDLFSSEMIKYASNAFLATKISFINEIGNLCEKLGANVEDVARGMGMDQRIGSQFLRAGIGYGGSCFPKDTKALVQIAGNVEHEFELLKAVITINNKQQLLLVDKALQRLGGLKGKRIAILGLAFKPNTDDMRESASIVVAHRLVGEGAQVVAYDPIAMEHAKRLLPAELDYAKTVKTAVKDADAVFILTDWVEFKEMDLGLLPELMRDPVVFDGRNCFLPDDARRHGIEYHSIGRAPAMRTQN